MGVNYNPKIVTNGLISYIDAGNPASYPGSGTIVYDLSKNDNYFTLQAATAYISADRVFRFTYGGTNWLTSNSLNGLGTLPTAGPVTSATFISMVKPTDNNTSRFFTFDTLGSDSTNRLNYYLYSSANIFGAEKNNSGEAWPASGFTNSYTFLNNWIMFGVTIDGLNHRWFIGCNGKFEAGTTGTLVSSPEIVSNVLIGRRGIDTNFGGDIANFMVYNRALSAQEVKQNFNALRGRFGI